MIIGAMIRKVNLTFKILAGAIALTIVIGIINYKWIIRKPECLFLDENLKDNRFYANIRGQNIDVIGWYHGTVERDLAQLAMADAINSAKTGNCSAAHERLKSALKNLGDQKIESERVVDALDEIYDKRPFQKLGVEYGIEQYREEFVDPNTSQDFTTEFISIFNSLCPEQIQQFSDLFLTFPGPEYKFVLDKKVVKIVPLGNDELIKKSFSSYSRESRSFPQQIDQLSPQARQAYDQFFELTKQEHSPNLSEVLRFAINLQEPEKSKIEKYFREATEALKIIKERDERFAEEILKSKLNIAVVIGNFHVVGLRNKLESQCKKP